MKSMLAIILILIFNTSNVIAEVKIGFVEIQKILKNAPQTVKANKNLEKEFTKRTNKLKKAVKSIQSKEAAFRKDSMTMSDGDRAKKQKEIQGLKIDAKRTEREVREDIDLRRREEIAKVQKLVNIAVENVAKDKGYDLVLYQGVAYAGKKVDITDVVIDALGKLK
ncbi:OmpH family outer membrane protein [Methylophilaceae bacterium]|nr:OmpH family outer membrane protein [Methylophilaceae bacterium]